MTHINSPRWQPPGGAGGGHPPKKKVAMASAYGISYEYQNCICDPHRLYGNILILKLKVTPQNG